MIRKPAVVQATPLKKGGLRKDFSGLALDFDGACYKQTSEHLVAWRIATINAIVEMTLGRKANQRDYDKLVPIALRGYLSHGSSIVSLKEHFNIPRGDQGAHRQLFLATHEHFPIELLPSDPRLARRLQNFGLNRIVIVTQGSQYHGERGAVQVFGREIGSKIPVIGLDTGDFRSKANSPHLWHLGGDAISTPLSRLLVVEDNPHYLRPAHQAGAASCALVAVSPVVAQKFPAFSAHPHMHHALDGFGIK